MQPDRASAGPDIPTARMAALAAILSLIGIVTSVCGESNENAPFQTNAVRQIAFRAGYAVSLAGKLYGRTAQSIPVVQGGSIAPRRRQTRRPQNADTGSPV